MVVSSFRSFLYVLVLSPYQKTINNLKGIQYTS